MLKLIDAYGPKCSIFQSTVKNVSVVHVNVLNMIRMEL